MRSVRYLSYLVLAVIASIAWGEPTGAIRGVVKDPDGKPIEKVTITIQSTGEKPSRYNATTNAKGEYIHIGIQSNDYRVTPSKEGYVPVEVGYVDLHIAPSDRPAQVDFKMRIAAAAAQQKKEGAAAEPSEAEKAMALIQQGKFDEAIVEFQKALTANPTNASIHFNLGVAYERKEQMTEARSQFEEATKLNPTFGEAFLALGNSYMREQKFDQGVPSLTKASELMPANYNAAYNLGACLANIGKYAEAEAAFRKAVQVSPSEPVAHYQLGMALLGQSKNADAKAEFSKYLELKPDAADKAEVEDLLKTLQ
jgi:Flp pilus assembly protein TadD